MTVFPLGHGAVFVVESDKSSDTVSGWLVTVWD